MTAQLPAFTTSWRKLPDELKLNILTYALPSTVNSEEVSGAFYQYGLQSEMDIRSLLMCPEISGLDMEALYSRSVVEVYDVSSIDLLGLPMTGAVTSSGTFELPPVAVRRYIQHLSVNIEHLVPETFGALARLSEAMPALQQLDITIQEAPSTTVVSLETRKPLRETLDRMPLIKFDAKQLGVTYYHTNVSKGAPPPLYNLLMPDDLELPLLSKFSVRGRALTERTERAFMSQDSALVDVSDAWPAFAYPVWPVRRTNKTLWV
jgi:hypothetical protein